MKLTKKNSYLIAIPFVLLTIFYTRLLPVLPAVMQDEYIYSVQSKYVPFADQAFPNYLYSFVYKSTTLCGDGYYSCAKNLNFMFFAMLLVFVFLIGNRLIGYTKSLIVASLTVLSPLSTFISFYMPEVMYFAFMAMSIWFALKAAQKNKLSWWIYAGISIGLTSLVKPHALFALPAICLFAFIASSKSETKSWKRALANTALFVATAGVIKFAVGFILAGSAGLTLFGSGYTGTIQGFVSNTSSTSSPGSSASGNIWMQFLSVAGSQVLMHLGILFILWGLPALLAAWVTKTAILTKSELSEMGSFVTLTGLLVFSFVVVVALFEALVTTLGDDHTHRIITRYYDFLIPFLLILGFMIDKYVEPKLWLRLLQAGLIAGFGVWILISFPGFINTQFADSVPIVGIMYWPGMIVGVIISVLAVLLYWVVRPEIGAKIVGYGLIPVLVVALGISSTGALFKKIGVDKAYFDVAGLQSKHYLDGVAGDRIAVFGEKKPEMETVMFWLDKPGIKLKFVNGLQLSESSFEDVDYALLLGASSTGGFGQTIVNGDRYVLIKVPH